LKPVTDGILKSILEAARWAPSGHNTQPWGFIVIRDPATKQKIRDISTESIVKRIDGKRENALKIARNHPLQYRSDEALQRFITGEHYEYITQAQVLIAVTTDMNAVSGLQDAFMAIQNMLLAAHSKGLGACPSSSAVITPDMEAQVKEILRVPQRLSVVSVICLGYPAESVKVEKKPLTDIVFREIYGEHLYG
jgi:nitroreductase